MTSPLLTSEQIDNFVMNTMIAPYAERFSSLIEEYKLPEDFSRKLGAIVGEMCNSVSDGLRTTFRVEEIEG